MKNVLSHVDEKAQAVALSLLWALNGHNLNKTATCEASRSSRQPTRIIIFAGLALLACSIPSVQSYAVTTTHTPISKTRQVHSHDTIFPFSRQIRLSAQHDSTDKKGNVNGQSSHQYAKRTPPSTARRLPPAQPFEPQKALYPQNRSRSPLENLHLLQKPKKAPPGFLRQRFPHFPWSRIPNWLTYVRCLAVPWLIWIFYQPRAHVRSSVVFAMASITDYLDGFLARRWDACSPFGSFLDPVADKLMVSTALVLLSGRYGAYVAVPAALILAREIGVSALREWMAQQGARDTVQVGWQGKCKTALTMVALTVLLLAPPYHTDTWLRHCLPIGLLLTYSAAALTVSSGWTYFQAAAPVLLAKDSSSPPPLPPVPKPIKTRE